MSKVKTILGEDKYIKLEKFFSESTTDFPDDKMLIVLNAWWHLNGMPNGDYVISQLVWHNYLPYDKKLMLSYDNGGYLYKIDDTFLSDLTNEQSYICSLLDHDLVPKHLNQINTTHLKLYVFELDEGFDTNPPKRLLRQQ